MSRWMTVYWCALCQKRWRLLGIFRRAHPPLCWHNRTTFQEWAPKVMEVVKR